MGPDLESIPEAVLNTSIIHSGRKHSHGVGMGILRGYQFSTGLLF